MRWKDGVGWANKSLAARRAFGKTRALSRIEVTLKKKKKKKKKTRRIRKNTYLLHIEVTEIL